MKMTTKMEKVAKGATGQAIGLVLKLIDKYADAGEKLDWNDDRSVASVMASVYNLGASLANHMENSDVADEETKIIGALSHERAGELIPLLVMMDKDEDEE